MNKKVNKPKKSVIENDEYFYRHPEMFRTKLEEIDEIEDVQDSINSKLNNKENIK